MSDLDINACVNVLNGLTADGLTRLQEAEKVAATNPLALAALPELQRRVKEDDIRCDCSECGSWDGLDRRCSCGNRRVYWAWEDRWGWRAEVY